ncbi:hypothetical protein A2966_04780 [Candidatus Roizmanbacteria bacterium RIFCSPLOWO2_01_FULL_41_22]|uniref:cysteine desulfurase n=1 Tax=Candidatus Roizmanbacteria bacterium RIFCSPLOWO2_01_FULL_41_22 TaxID=1802067 RepID=A0A1F7JB04_9BACT|nr:MAG: hypothetical protein A2966_04780 [Candidatus Roizmanbacteria bacterium RIFCSPLOWO2_01_FULL_41_22]
MDKIATIKKDFPIFARHPNLTYLDSAATSLKPLSVVNKIQEYYQEYSANIHRGIYQISEKATQEYEETRQVVTSFINAESEKEIVYTRSATEGLNLVATSLGSSIVGAGDEIVITIMEHHSNFVPWQQLAKKAQAKLKIIGVTPEGYLDLELDNIKYTNHISKIVNNKTKILAITYVSNVLGTINPIKEIIAQAKKINPKIIVVVDGAQAVPHMPVDVQDLGADFLVFSGHKMLGPTGIGILWGKQELFEKMPPYQYGGDMIKEVAIENTIYQDAPWKFEAGTPHIAGVIGLKEAIRYLQKIGMHKIHKREQKLLADALKRLQEEFGDNITVLGPQKSQDRAGVMAFRLADFHPHDIAQILDESHIAIRAGHHCAMPLHTYLKFSASARASFYIYNNDADIEKLITGLKKAEKTLTK